jgi:hypothetical protein
MKSDLRNLVSSQESFFADSARYTTVLTVSGLNFKSSTGVTDPVIAIGAGFWTATNSHSQLTGVVCGIGINTTSPTVSTAGEGEPACK